jgi:hypothetical protein
MVAVTMPFDTEITLMLLETWLTTQATSSDNGLTETGPSPTGISTSNVGWAGVVTLNTDNELFAVLTANKRVPSAERRIGLVCDGSKFAYAGDAACTLVAIGVAIAASTRNVVPKSDRLVSTAISPPACITTRTKRSRWAHAGWRLLRRN